MTNLATNSPESVKLEAYTIVIAVILNTLVKTGMAAFMGSPALRRTLVWVTAVLLGAGVARILVV